MAGTGKKIQIGIWKWGKKIIINIKISFGGISIRVRKIIGKYTKNLKIRIDHNLKGWKDKGA